MKRIFASSLVLCALLASTPAVAQSRHSIHWKDTTAIRYNPLGLVSAAEVDYRLRMYMSPASILYNYVSIAATPMISPAYSRLGGKLEIMPLALMSLAVKYEYINFFGTFDFLQSFPDQTADMSDAALAANGDADQHYATSGTQLSFIGLLQAKVGSVAIRTRATLFQNRYDVRDGDTVLYDPLLDNVLPADGWGITNELDGIYMKRALIAGVRYTYTKAFLDEVPNDTNQAQHRVGPLVLYEVFRRPPKSALNSIKLLGLFQWYVSHRYRSGQETTIALPYLGVGAILEGRIL